MNLIKTHGRAANVALQPAAHFGAESDYTDFVRRLNGQVNVAKPSKKVALAIPKTTFLKSETKVIELQPQVDFKGERLVLSSGTGGGTTQLGLAANFTVNSVKVGREEQLTSPTPIVGNVFGQATQRVIGLNMKVCPPSLKIYLELTNLDSKISQNISGMLVGSCGGCNEDSCGVVSPDGDTYEPLIPIGIPITLVKAGTTKIIELQPQVPFTGQQLVIPTSMWDTTGGAVENTSNFFTINSVKVGREEQMLSTGALAATLFADNSQQGIGLSMKKCPTSLKIYIEVENVDGADHDFGGTIYGFCGDDGNCNTGLCHAYDIGEAAASRPVSSTQVNGGTLVAAARRILAMAPQAAAPSAIY